MVNVGFFRPYIEHLGMVFINAYIIRPAISEGVPLVGGGSWLTSPTALETAL